jgi:hypothetical protein
MTEEQKQPYINLKDKDVLRYENEMEQYKTKGYFVNAEGIHSNEIKVLPLSSK